MRVLVTGSSGFIGRWVCRTLAQRGVNVAGLDVVPARIDNGMPFLRCNILEFSALRHAFSEVQPDLVVHLAARVDLRETRDLQGYAANIEGVRNVLRCVQECTAVRRVLVTSSQLVCRVGHVPADSSDYCPDTLYGESKMHTERITREMDGGGKEWCLTRPTTVWGPGMSPHYQAMLRLIHAGRFFHCGHGKLYKSYAYAGNIAFQYHQLLRAPVEAIHRKTFYLADYTPLSLRDYINGLAIAIKAPPVPTLPLFVVRQLARVGDLANRLGLSRVSFNSFRLRNILTEYQFDLRATRNVCGDLPYSFEEGIRATAEWWLHSAAALRNGQDAPDWPPERGAPRIQRPAISPPVD